MIQFRDNTGLFDPASIQFRDVTGLFEPAEILMRDGTGVHLVWDAGGALAVTIPVTTFGSSFSTSATFVQTAVVTAEITGGREPYSHVWTRTDGGGGTWGITNATGAETAFNTTVSPNAQATATFIDTVTDASGTVVASNTLTATAFNFGGLF